MEAMIETEHDTWIEITDEMIEHVGYKTKESKGNVRTHLFSFIKRTYKKDTQYKLTTLKTTKAGWGGQTAIRNDTSNIQ